MKRAVFLDRDGVLNRSKLVDGVPTPPNSIQEIEIIEGVVEAIQILKNHGFVPVVVTNQPDVARGYTTQSQVEAINNHIGIATDIAYFYTCFHDDQQGCDCRKPKPGLLQKAAQDLNVNLHNSFLIGDRWRDIAAGQAVGSQCFFIDYEYSERSPDLPYYRVKSLLEAAQKILEIHA